MKHIAQFMKRYIILILSFLTSSCWLMAQPYIIKRLGIEQGLSNNYVVGITQDKQGFLWFATEEGLNKLMAPASLPIIRMIRPKILKVSPAMN